MIHHLTELRCSTEVPLGRHFKKCMNSEKKRQKNIEKEYCIYKNIKLTFYLFISITPKLVERAPQPLLGDIIVISAHFYINEEMNI